MPGPYDGIQNAEDAKARAKSVGDKPLHPTAAGSFYPNEQYNAAHASMTMGIPITVASMTEQGRQIMEHVLPDVVNLFLRKNNGYGGTESLPPLGLRGYFTDIYRKLPKLKRAVWDGGTVAANEFESTEEILMDLIGSCLLMLWQLKFGGEDDIQRAAVERMEAKAREALKAEYKSKG